ncbi:MULTISPECIES: RHS repeat domain-containing protein [Bacteroidales]|uniref:RHS domain-containing protein n=2 Tax=Porphyromonas TaxID=836 RepID=A0AAE9XGF7_PORGN|nr:MULTISPECIES: RHS repeat-associated core domain-containing protein [Bacteroidales]WCG03976.1 RHS domain-containing protein [Porphyromonas gingivalis]SJL33465.1 Putative deoxyribonuclease RhsC [Porphyromonas gingivalis]
MSQVTDERGNVFRFLFDGEYRPVQLTYPNGTYRQWMYDARGYLSEERDPRGNHTFYRSDEAGNLLWMQEADGNEHHFSYDTSGNLVHAKDRIREVSFRYGSLGTLLSRTQNGRTVCFEYDTELQLTGIANEGGELYRFALDGRGDVVDEWGFDGLHRHYERDGAGRVSKVLRPDERWSTYEYDGVGRIVGKRHSDGTGTAYKYNKDGLLTAAFNDSIKIGFERCRDGRVLKETQGEHMVESVYDAFGSRIRLCSDLGADVALQYDTEGLPAGMQSNDWSMSIGRDKSGLEIQRELSGGVSVTTGRDMLGRVVRRDILSGGLEQSRMRYHWSMGNRLLRKVNERTGETVLFDYDRWDNLFRADYKGGSELESIYKAPDAIGNLFRTEERKDRKYGKGGRLLEDKKFSYHYDGEGNLVLKQRLRPDETLAPLWQEGDWAYEWQGNGMLRSVKRPDGEMVSFEYDPLGRRISKTYKDKTTRWVWDGNVPLHEWTEESDVTTWLFEEGAFVPAAKIVGDKSYSIITDYLGTPTEMFNSDGEKTWSAELDIYGSVRNFAGRSLSDCPFRYQGQYEDEETGLYYNRFRYYSPDSGIYISQDPIRLAGNNPTLYAYVHDTNVWIDSWGLKGTGIPFQVGLHEDLIKINAGTGLDSHHVGQKALMDKLVANYDEMKAPAILVPSVGHTRTKDGVGIVSRSPINPKTGKPFTNARELLARDIRELRRVYGDTISNKQLQELINLNKSMYPEMNKPKTGHH